MKILVLDNYDSFTYNLVHILRELGHNPDVYRNDKITTEAVKEYDKILISPGPGLPDEAGVMKDVIRTYSQQKSILGICLGLQGIGEVFGASLFNIPKVLHGVTTTTTVSDPDEVLFQNVTPSFLATHYHSWAVDPNTIPDSLVVTATNEDGLVMGIRHREFDVRGLQFHPESVMTTEGPKMLRNWLQYHKI
ncbi:MAG TPA: aminodeoxychorismate/anthranilate synthase component II [Cyclobacteriaceae bacterium]|nr:aminodeoxychorismate/anthranilate synthase component II [Cyclobacteriaceae bacterium]